MMIDNDRSTSEQLASELEKLTIEIVVNSKTSEVEKIIFSWHILKEMIFEMQKDGFVHPMFLQLIDQIDDVQKDLNEEIAQA